MSRLKIVMYHYVRDLAASRYPRIKGLDEVLFRQQIGFFAQHFSVVTMEQVLQAVQEKTPLPDNALLLTFDDGYTDHFETVMPVLTSYGMQGSFFIPGQVLTNPVLLDVNKIQYLFAAANVQDLVRETKTLMDRYRGETDDYPETAFLYERYAVPNRFDDKEIRFVKHMLQTVLPEHTRKMIIRDLFEKYIRESEEILARELYMSVEQMREMRRQGMFIGVHGYLHGWLADMNEEDRRADLMRSLDILADVIDRDAWVVNYPYGNYSRDAAATARSLGAVLGLTVEAREADLSVDDPMTLPRLDCNDFPPKSERYLEKGTT